MDDIEGETELFLMKRDASVLDGETDPRDE
jgi:hypothetical protein